VVDEGVLQRYSLAVNRLGVKPRDILLDHL